MLSFELSVIDIVLVIAMVILLLLFLAQIRGQPATKSESPVKSERKLSEELKVLVKIAKEKLFKTQPSTDFQKCVHNFGYLKDHPKNTPVPDECFGCPNIMRCLFPNE